MSIRPWQIEAAASGRSPRLPRLNAFNESIAAGRLAVDFVVESDCAQLSEIVRRVRDGRLRTNIGSVSTLDDAVAAFYPTKTQGEDDHLRSSVRTR